ncbi:molybdate ABC transporter substrate-binding protein [Lysinibacillus antri]|uniref:Molybdate ABC transporter substrate-binding protein n=1 Tax=Lysinibacillus antri TaxID=2498145 RepID=A0A432LCK0_9BACI|nr:molybdate ABC transporter substrate-binding protein [Lysinibacillus antri]RUL52235.1 molybdate ABC transporter substrate-binding protein [Lysinibacillus antri]
MSKKLQLIFILCLALLISGCSENDRSSKQAKLTISIASSLQDAMEEVIDTYIEKNPNVHFNINVGSSGTLEAQIKQGAQVDLFFSASKEKFDHLVEAGDISSEDHINLLKNELVLIVPKNNKVETTSFQDLNKSHIEPISIGTPETVPAGYYAKETFEHFGIWEEIQEKFVYAKDVRQVLTYVETGNVTAGVVYKTDALLSDQVKIVASAKEDSHSPIVYPVGILKDSPHYDEIKSFYTFLQSEQSLKVFEKYGFIIQ